ncbi:EAL domain-containing protein [Cyanobium sp. T1G-Tous]|uniref:GGDEF domain-containing phosphodiesterase n=1 Tax=Cyanobium sp. T1G-Tous TaxID=2823722 RepID=UPI0020CC7E4E|nr:GGDEF domain-containing phosphodiesterase [Cyanobium sp. T1G-Tous]MCP9803428.1 EAL domain-containing protein [Cyanobium sp. T1G-Tous]
MSSKYQASDRFDVVCDLAEAITGSEAARVLLASVPLPSSEVLVIDGTGRDSRLDSLLMPDSDKPVNFYARFPLISRTDFALGSLCLYDSASRTLDPRSHAAMLWLATQTVSIIEADLAPALAKPQSSEEQRALDLLISRGQLLRQLDRLLELELHPPFALVRCQLKGYGSISATLGGRPAEALVNEAARRLINAVPKTAYLARFSDSQFIFLISDLSDENSVVPIVTRIIDLFVEPFRIAEHRVPLSVAIGITLQQGSYSDPEDMLADANMALRIASRHIHSQYRFFDLETRRLARESYALEADVRLAIQQKEMIPFFQPIVDLNSGEPMGFEVLARWPRADGNFVSPSVFVPVARSVGLTAELDLQIIEKALEHAGTLSRVVPWRSMVLSVNLSANLLDDLLMRRRFLQLIDDHQLPMGWYLQAEILEESLQDATSGFDEFLRHLSERQIRITIDDFGTGYSSLSRLTSMPINGFKIDLSFVQLLDDPVRPSNKLVSTMGALADDLGLSTTAEGVETQRQRTWLIDRGFRLAQGFLFAPPMSLGDAMSYLESLRLRSSAIAVELDPPPLRFRDRLLRFLLNPF